MKIGIITFHFPYNCGASLQCFALQKALENMGHEVCVIDYCPEYHKNLYRPLRNPIVSFVRAWNSCAPSNIIKKFVTSAKAFAAAVFSWKNYKGMKQADELFNAFSKDYLNLTKKYKKISQLKVDYPDCDMYISGSDQLWNISLTGNKFDESYFLKFGKKQTRRITYAVSTKFSNDLDEQTKLKLKELLSDLNAISVRETDNIDLISKLANKINVCKTIDPTLLLDVTKYDEIIDKNKFEDEPYILTYCISSGTQKVVMNIANKLAKNTSFKLVNALCYPKISNKINNTRICGPKSFLWYIKNAEYIVTDSFHGTIFSILFAKKFVALPRGASDKRVSELLMQLGIENRVVVSEEEAINTVVKDIDYTAVNKNIENIKIESIKYLKSNIAACENSSFKKVLSRVNLNKENCCGCSACVNSCPVSAITMVEDEEGFEYPSIDEEKCIECKVCVEVCKFKKDQIEKKML